MGHRDREPPQTAPETPPPDPANEDGAKRKRRPDDEPEDVIAPWIRDLIWRGSSSHDLEVDGWGIVYHQGTYYRYTGTHYVRWPETAVRAAAARWCQDSGRGKPAMNFTSNMMLGLSGRGTHIDLDAPPCWIDGRPAPEMLSLGNGILDLHRWLRCEPDPLRPRTPRLFCLTGLDYEYHADAQCPNWQAFLDEVLPEPDLQRTIQQWFGYCLLASQKYQRFLILRGEGANGKSILCSVLRALVGPRNCSAVGLGQLHLPHATHSLVGKTVNFASEVRYIHGEGEEVLKLITGGDAVEINPKNQHTYTMPLHCRFVITTNNDLKFSDRSAAAWRRILIVPFRHTVPVERRLSEEDMMARLLPEMSGILNWALDGLSMLETLGQFRDTDETRLQLDELKRDSNPVAQWAEETVVYDPQYAGFLTTHEAYSSYKLWAKTEGYNDKTVPVQKTFSSNLVRYLRDKLQTQDVDIVRRRIGTGRASVIEHLRYADDAANAATASATMEDF